MNGRNRAMTRGSASGGASSARTPRRVAETLLGLGVLAFGVVVVLLPGPVFAVLLGIALLGLAILATKLHHPVKMLLGRLKVGALRVLGGRSPGGPEVRP